MLQKTLPLTMANYQVLIVGAGVAGLHCALRISERHPSIKIAIAESYNYVGGRCYTFKHNDTQWESGAGRVHSSHTMTNRYIDAYKLTKIPINSMNDWISEKGQKEPNTWPILCKFMVDTLSTLNPRLLASNTISEVMDQVYGKEQAKKFLNKFAYRSEVTTLRADLALKSFKGEMGAESGFFVIKEGFSELVHRMRATLESRGVEFLFSKRLISVEPHSTPILCKFDGPSISADKVILAIHSEALKKIKPFTNLPALKHLQMTPLLRTYGVFPTNAKGESWFSGYKTMVTDSPLRHIIPINPNKGVIMTSYTDAEDTKPWTKILKTDGEKALKKSIMTEMKKIFPGVPNPLFFKSHLWKHGTTYWTPGLYDPVEMGEKIMNPLPSFWQNLYVCGESFSQRQAWVEGALENADMLINKFF